MTLYKHYSFDLWMTLIRSNPEFKKERALFFHTHFNAAKKSIEEIDRIFRSIDTMCNAINEKTGKNIDSEELYLMVIYEMNDRTNAFQDIDLRWLYSEMETLVLKHMPVVYADDTIDTLERISQMPGTTLSLLSNTAFIKGVTLRKVLESTSLSRFFDFQLYSDEVGLSKPNSRFFQQMIHEVRQRRRDEMIEPHEIIHIGDNERADIWGAESTGIRSLLVNSNEKPISTLLVI